MSFSDLARRFMSRRRALARHREEALPWWQRLDAAWLAIAAAGAITLAGAGAVVAELHGVHGLFDGPVVAPAPDARILRNFRTTPSAIADAAVVPGDDALFVARTSGTVHRLGLRSRVWSEEQFDPGRLFASAIAVLQPGCPHPGPACAAADALYAVTEQGGVAMRERGRWRMLMGDNAFIGLDGNAVAHTAIPAMAAADGGRFLVFGTERQGVGVFDTRDRRWITVPDDVQARIFGAAGTVPRVSRVVADGDGRVWVGTARGVGILSGLGHRLQGTRVEGLGGETLDMLPEAGGGMLVLGIEACPGPGPVPANCTALRRVDRGGAVAATVAGETERNDFDEADISHVAAVAGHIRAFGRKGVYDYVEDRRRFELQCRGEVTAVWQGGAGGTVVYAQNQDPSGRGAHCRRGDRRDEALTGTVVTTLDPATGQESAFRITDERIDHITLGADGQPWLLARRGSNRLFVLTADGPRELGDAARLAASAGPLLEHATAAVEVEGRILLVGDDGAVLHDPVTRTYRFIDRAGRPEDLAAPGARLYAEDNVVWIVSASNWLSAVRVYPGTTALLDGVRRWQAPEPTRFTSAQVTRAGLVVTTDTGRFWLARLNHDNAVEVTPVLGPPPSRPLGPVVDAIADDDGAIVADAQGIFRYDARRRGWSGPTAGPRGEAITALAKSAADLFMLGANGSVAYESSTVRLFGDGTPFAFARAELTDAFVSGRRLFLTAPGRVAVYDTAQHRHADQWDLPAGALTIAGVVDGQPVVWDRDGAWLGRSQLMIGDTRVTSASVADDSILTVQRDPRGTSFVAEFKGRGAPPRCLFRDTEAAHGAMLDARRIAAAADGATPAADGAVAVLSADRLRLYAPTQRRWIGVDGITSAPTARLAALGSHLAVHDHERLTLLPLTGPDALQLPASCSGEAARSRGAVAVDGRAVAVDEATARAAVLSAEGRIIRWQPDGPSFTPVLEAAGTAPPPRDLRRVVDGGRALHFAAADAIWSYDLDVRRWRQRRLKTAGEPVRPRSLSLALADGLLTLSVRDDRNRDFAAVTAADGAATAAVPLREIGPGAAVTAPFDPASLIDAAEEPPGRWLFLTAGQLSAFDTATATFTVTPLPAPYVGMPSLVRYGGDASVVAVAEGDPARPSRLTFVPAPRSGSAAPGTSSFRPQPGERVAVAAGDSAEPRLLRVLADDEVRSCAIAPTGELRPCETLLPPALTLDAAATAQAFAVGGATVIVPASPGAEVRVLDRRGRTSTALADLDPGAAEFLDTGTEVWIREPSGRIRAVDRDGAVRVVAQAADMVREIAGSVFVITGGVAARLGPGGRLETENDIVRRVIADATAASVLPSDSGDIDVLTTAGEVVVIDHDGIVSDRLDVAALFDPAAIDSAVMAAPGHAWVLHGSTLSLVQAGGCPGARPGQPCIAAERPLPPGLRQGAILRMVDGGRFVFDDTSYRWDAGAWHAVAGGGVGRELRQPRNARNELAAAARDGRLDAVVLQQDGADIVVARPGVPTAAPLRFRGSLAAEQPPALGSSGGRWLRFDRGRQLFQIAGRDGGTVAVTLAELFPGGVFAPTLPGRSVATGAAAFVHANAAGLWSFPLEHDWTDHGPTFTRIGLPSVTAAARGRFYFEHGSSIAVDGTRIEFAPRAGAIPDYVVVKDGLTVAEDVRGETVTAAVDVAGRPVDAFAAQGFWHDTRLGIAFDRAGVVIATPEAIVNPRDFHATAAPPGFAAASDALLFNAAGSLYARVQGHFLRADGNRWSEVRGDPRDAPASLATAAGVTFVRDGAAVTVTGEPWRTRSGPGWRFSADSLEGAAHTATGTIAAVTREGIVEARDLDGLIDAGPPRRKPAAATGVLERHFRTPAEPVTGFVFKDAGGDARLGVTLAGRDFTNTPGEDPLLSRVAVRQGFLTVAFRNRVAAVDAEAERPGGGRTTIAVDWRRDEHFPFDRATAIAASGDTLYVGTAAGLIVTRASAPVGEPRLVDTGAGDHLGGAVDRIGRPAAAPARLIARSGARCTELRGTAVSRCNDADALDERFLGAGRFWKWTARSAPEMVYRDAAGTALGRPVTSFSDGFPHDHPTAAVDCGSFGRVSVWGEGLVLATAGVATSDPFMAAHGWGLDGRTTITDLRAPFRGTAIALHCERAPRPQFGGTAIAAGVYALSQAQGTVMLHDGTKQDDGADGWRREPDADARAVVARWRGAVPYDHARLRLVDNRLEAGSTRGGLELQYLTRARQWRPLKVAGGRYLIDERLDIVTAHGATHVVTPEGLVRFSGSRYGLDPDAVDIVAVPCDVDLIETADGRGAAVPAEPGAPTLVRCRDGSVLAGTLDGSSDADVFTERRAGDPFVERDAAVSGATGWRIVDRGVGQPGRLDVAWRNERLPLADGRFALDVWSSLARLGRPGPSPAGEGGGPDSDPAVIEMASLQGWIRSPAPAPSAGLPLDAVERPKVAPEFARTVRKLAVDVGDDGREVLCLIDDSGRTATARPAGNGREGFQERHDGRSCGRLDGAEASHGPWLYRASLQGPAPLTMRSRDRSGASVDRAMTEGRFTDLIAAGAPVAAAQPEPGLTLVPTPAGISGIGADGGEAPVETVTGPPPLALLVTGSGAVKPLTADGFAGAERDRPCPLAHTVAGLDAMHFIALAMAGDDVLEVTGRRDGKPVFYSVACGAEAPVALPWSLAVAVSGRRRVTANGLPWDRVWLNASDGEIAAAALTPVPARRLFDTAEPPVRLLDGGDRAFAVTADDVLEVDVDALISALSRDR